MSVIDSTFFNDILGLGYLYDYQSEHLTKFAQGSQVLSPPHVRHIGYVVQKIEFTKEGDLIQNQAKFFGRSNMSQFVDLEVAYGRSYTYKIRSVSAVEYDFLVSNPNNGAPMKIRGLFFIGSKNSTINLKAIETIPPEPPPNIRFNYQRNRGMLLEWDYPFNPQRDIVGFHIYRRKSIEKPFTLIKEINFDKSIIKTKKREKALLSDTVFVNSPRPWFLDSQFNNDSKYIYAVSSFDAHGMSSNYSSQYLVSYDRPTNSINVSTISNQSAPKAYPNMFLNIIGTSLKNSDLFKDNFKVSKKNRMTIFFNPDYYHAYKKGNNTNIKEKAIKISGMSPSSLASMGLGSSMSIDNNTQLTTTNNVNLLQTATENDEPVYRLHMINVDLQKDEIFDICIGDVSTKSKIIIPTPVFEENNFSFEMVHPDKYQQ